MGTHTGNVITLANSIIGVSVLAMPFCFKQCGIILSILMLLFSNIISRLSCHYLMKAAIMEKRKNFEMLAFRAFGPTGKLTVELCIIGFMLGTCIAYFVIMGDLGPGIIGPTLGFQHPAALRPSVLIAIAIFVVLPLGLLKNVDSLGGVCAATVGFYACLVLKVLGEAIEHLVTADWIDKVYYWRPSGILQCIPIFSMALFCQTQLFEIFDSLPSTPLDRMNSVVRSATNMVTIFYISVGLFGYIAYCDQTFAGNLMMNFSQTITSEVIKIGFLLSVAVSFPLVIFPCRASIHSLLFSKGYEHAQTGSAHIPESRFQCITLVIVTLSLVMGLLMPNIELVLGLVGSTIGVIICVIVPAVTFVSLSSRNNNERLLAKLLVFTGLVIMILGTYANLYATEEAISKPILKHAAIVKDPTPIPKALLQKVEIKDETLKNLKNIGELAAALPNLKSNMKFKADQVEASKQVRGKEGGIVGLEKIKDIKREPPVPEEPVILQNEKKTLELDIIPKDVIAIPVSPPKEEVQNNISFASSKVKDDVKVDVFDKKVKEKDTNVAESKQNDLQKEILFEKIKEHQEAQEKLIAEGEELMNKLKMVVKQEIGLNNSKDLGVGMKLSQQSAIEGALQDAKTEEKKVEPEKSIEVIPEGPLVSSMAKGVPLPLAIKEKVQRASKDKQEVKSDNDVEKIGRDILGGDTNEFREKRDVEEVLSESLQTAAINKNEIPTTPEPTKVPIKEEVKTLVPVNPDIKPIEAVAVEEGTCAKNSSIEKDDLKKSMTSDTISNKTDEKELIKKPDDQLIKFSSHLSNDNQILDVSPQILDSKESVIAEMPKKRDLKSIVGDDASESNQRNA